MALSQSTSNVVIFGADGDVLAGNWYVKNVIFSGHSLTASPITASLSGLADDGATAITIVPLDNVAVTADTWNFLFNEALLIKNPKFNSNDANLKMYLYLEAGYNL